MNTTCCEKCHNPAPAISGFCNNDDCPCHKPQVSDWEIQLEYALPKTLTEEEKQIIRNNVKSLLAQQRNEIIEKVEGMRKDENAREQNGFEVKINWATPMYNQAIKEVLEILKQK